MSKSLLNLVEVKKYYLAYLFFYLFFSCKQEASKSVPEKNQIEPNEKSTIQSLEPTMPDYKKLICAKWKINYEETIALLSDEKKMEIGENITSFKETFAGISYEFKENGNCIYNAGISPIEGKTSWDINGEMLEIKEEGKIVFSYEIRNLTNERLVLKSNESGELFTEIVFERSK